MELFAISPHGSEPRAPRHSNYQTVTFEHSREHQLTDCSVSKTVLRIPFLTAQGAFLRLNANSNVADFPDHAPPGGRGVDFDNSPVVLKLVHLVAALAEFEREIIRERVRAGYRPGACFRACPQW